ncbi:MAG: hypothetical protein Q9166_001365 [cf. Caloplaca sp. 2 TL-2023]
MAWPWSFGTPSEDTCTAWGYTFQLTPQHLTKDDTNALKESFDRLGEAALNRLNVLCPPQSNAQQTVKAPGSIAAEGPSTYQPLKRDMYISLRDHALEDEVLGRLWANVNTVPSWVCWEQISRGQEVFYRYGGPVLTGLAFQSLLGGMVD